MRKIKDDSLNLKRCELKMINNALKRGETSIFSPSCLDKFELNIASYLHKNYSITLPNCTTAISLAIKLANIPNIKYVIVPNLTHSSVVNAIISLKYKLVVCDFKPNTNEMDLNSLPKDMIAQCGAMVVCYLHGYPLNIEEIKDFCKRYSITLIEDLAQGLGVKGNSTIAGELSDYACCSYGECKTLRIGEGGTLACNENIVNEINTLRHVGEIYDTNKLSTVKNDISYLDFVKDGLNYTKWGFNFRVIPYTFAFANYRLTHLDKFLDVRQKKLQMYCDCISNDKLEFVGNLNGNVNRTAPISAWLICDDSKYFEKLFKYLLSLKIPVGKFKYQVLTKVASFREHIKNADSKMINSEYLQQHSLFLPLYENISFKDIQYICDKINNFEGKDVDFNMYKKLQYFDGFFVKWLN